MVCLSWPTRNQSSNNRFPHGTNKFMTAALSIPFVFLFLVCGLIYYWVNRWAWYKITIYKYGNGNRFPLHSTIIRGDEMIARRIGQELVKVMSVYENKILTYE